MLSDPTNMVYNPMPKISIAVPIINISASNGKFGMSENSVLFVFLVCTGK